MTKQKSVPVDLNRVAERAVVDHGFDPDFDKECMHQLEQIERVAQPAAVANTRDLRDLLWSSIDNIDSRDLDQIEFAEELDGGDIRLLVGIADVDGYVFKDTPLDRRAAANCFSIYTGVRIFPMLPKELSENLTSLLQDQDRHAMVSELVIGADGEMKSFDIYQALVRNKAKLAYERVADWLDGKEQLEQLREIAGLEQQLRLQDKLADRLENLHKRRGEVNVQTIEAHPIISDGRILDLSVQEQNRAREIIKNIMIAANIGLAEFLRSKKFPIIERVVREPKRWPRIVELASSKGFSLPQSPDSAALSAFVAEQRQKDPDRFPDLSLAIVKLLGPGEYVVQLPDAPSDGHFGLALHDYTHSTAPNRRYPDLVTQRIVKAALRGKSSPYSAEALNAICQRCVEMENSQRKLERYMRKVSAAILLADHIGQTYDAIVTGASNKGTYVRLITPPAEGRVMRNERGLDVGDKCRVKLISTDPAQGFIDFERV
jgi:exoribonuclease-2